MKEGFPHCKICGLIIAPMELEDWSIGSYEYEFYEDCVCFFCASFMKGKYGFETYKPIGFYGINNG